MQQKLAEYLNCIICEYWENYDWEENNISEYLPVSSVEDFIIDELKEEEE
jgi:hypothetical protein